MSQFLLVSGLLFSSGTLFSQTLDQQRSDFLAAEKLLQNGNEREFLALAAPLEDYPLYPYLQYQWLKEHLEQTDKVLVFLSAFKETRYAELLRSEWLVYLANKERWLEYIANYQADNRALECLFYWAHYKVGNQQLALQEAKRLWMVGHEQAKQCDGLLSLFEVSPILTSDVVWQRFKLALKEDNESLASYVQRFLPQPDQRMADLWLLVHKKPLLIQTEQFLSGDEQMGAIFVHGVDRIAKLDLDLAITIWDARKLDLLIDNVAIQQLDRKLALALARNQDVRAYSRLNKLFDVDAEVREWKVRVALREQNWQHIAEALAGLSFEEQQTPQWQYWQARALVENGYFEQGQVIYNKLSEDRSYYGFMAADVVNKPYSIADKPIAIAESEIDAFIGTTDFKVVQEFKILGRETDAKRQWWFALKKLSKEQLIIAAKLAQKWQWDQIAIVTLVKADYWDDLALRFPVKYLDAVQHNASRQAIDAALILGIIRQESMLDENARSAVGALGLMQIMPNTGKQMAHQLKETWQLESSLFHPSTNIKYGSYYYKQLLLRFGGHFALAMAAYNAGPNRVIKWLPTDRAMPADIWIEIIPYKETRKYVASVLSYTTIYQQRMQLNPLKITRFLFDVPPY
jgi:soluble lytic murein transglycosylase